MQATVHHTLANAASLFDKPIPISTRAQAIADGALIDVTETAVEAGFTIPVAMTRNAWNEAVAWTDQDSQRQTMQHVANRLWNVIWTLRCHSLVKRAKPTRELRFEVHCVPRDMKSLRPQATLLKAAIQPGDAGEAVITIMLPRED